MNIHILISFIEHLEDLMENLKRKFGDRYDGYRVKKVEPFFLVVPYIMKTRVDSQVYFADRLDNGNREIRPRACCN